MSEDSNWTDEDRRAADDLMCRRWQGLSSDEFAGMFYEAFSRHRIASEQRAFDAGARAMSEMAHKIWPAATDSVDIAVLKGRPC